MSKFGQTKPREIYYDYRIEPKDADGESQCADHPRSMANVGRMLEFVPDLDRDHLIGIGYSCAKELARLAPTKDQALVAASDIVTLVMRRKSGQIPNHAAFSAEVDRLLGKEGEGEGEAPKPEKSEKPEDWRTKYRSALAKAGTEAEFVAMLQELLG